MSKSDEEEAAKMASRFGENATKEDVDNVKDKMDGMKRGPLAKVWDKVQALWRGFNSPQTPGYMKAIIIGGLIYMVTPLDLVPDFIPVVGLLDDVGVIGMVFKQFLNIGVIGITAGTIVKLAKIGKAEIIADIKKHNADAYSVKIKNIKEKGDYVSVDIGLRNKNGQEIGTKQYQASKADKNIKEGMVIRVE